MDSILKKGHPLFARRPWLLLVMATTALVAMGARDVAAMEVTDRQGVRAKLTAKRPAASTGTRIEMRFENPQRPGAKPHSVDQVVIRSPRGTRFDHGALPQCLASDAELMARGPSACPGESRVQAGAITLDTGSPLGVPRILRLRTVTFNSRGGFVSLGEGENFPIRGVVRSATQGRTTTVDYADAPGVGGPDGYSAMTTMLTAGPAVGAPSRPFLQTPSSCPHSGRWRTRFTFIYHDGVRQVEDTRTPCKRPSIAGPVNAKRSSRAGRGPDRGSRQELSMRFTSSRAGRPAGTRVGIQFRDPDNPGGKPIPVRREEFLFPRGTRFNPTVVPTCMASQAELLLVGEAACPKATRVGVGKATGVSGSPFDPVDLEIDAFENGSGFALLTTVRELGVRFVARSVRRGRSISVKYPHSPGGPPDGETALRDVNNFFPARTLGRRAYVRTPRSCPRSGHWRFVGRFTYRDGLTQQTTSRQSCRD